ncbi:hypothetical protein TPA0910_04420 [Streptomyces hygroscopicus subsp. sporocinereus]|uniref:Uncharacterized protein n=1 Tax=Streptomyces hygroscopicus TaxID=1912 RepID=A0ABQ3TRP9_STRHY|nr:hypothetical protein TPA0910_04420 [Streptomyces hygroscopicus]
MATAFSGPWTPAADCPTAVTTSGPAVRTAPEPLGRDPDGAADSTDPANRRTGELLESVDKGASGRERCSVRRRHLSAAARGSIARRSIALVQGVPGRCDDAARCRAGRRERGAPCGERS